jgi:hypothetical protein
MLTPRLRAFFDACFSNPLLSQSPSEPDAPPSVSSLTTEEIQASRRERLRGLSGPGKESPPE